MVRVALFLAYDGTDFHGFAVNPGVPTIGGTIGRALGQVMTNEPTITCAGRTDKGVHARRQVVTFDTDQAVEPWKLRHSLNGLCGPDISVEHVRLVADDFDARSSATGRRYRYTLENRQFADPMLRRRVWNVKQPLELDTLNAAAQLVEGSHDFSSFCRRKIVETNNGPVVASRVRNVRSARWERDPVDDGLIHFWIEANAFCQQMVRSIVGSVVDVGLGLLDQAAITQLLSMADRNEAGKVAPPQGLTLWDVFYNEIPELPTQ